MVEVPAGTTIYKAAKQLDIDIPILCYMDLKDLNIENKPGGCRICSVEVEGRTIRVIELDGRRISRLLVGSPPDPAPDAADREERAPSTG